MDRHALVRRHEAFLLPADVTACEQRFDDGGSGGGAITSNSVTNSISLIHTLAASDGTAILPYPSIVIVVRSIGCTLYGETSAYLALKGGYVVFKFSVGHL